MVKALISGRADRAHRETETTEQEPLKRVCAYVEAVGACLLIGIVAVLLF
ncbi:hypothetical protein M9978_10165 [Sphingomonas sp. MG17]|jgi:hypothetical protein|uniref:Uncharacterized protein n=1 Tax=Sphingomonas tagetis TaxID=2949092 RepID=A0A9X2KKR7_9SPHN|nr:hypothetical protein [Sphingomonas tagetis]MCP3730794.1 hypothetical protein [Sphingomonas tagetis]